MANDQYTKALSPDGLSGFTSHGHITREEAITAARGHYKFALEEAQKFLALTDEQITVYQCTGLYREKRVVELPVK